jgi:hypothetical protein
MGRVAFRKEGKWWNAYYAMPDTMKGAIHLGSILMTLVQDQETKQAFMTTMRSAREEARSLDSAPVTRGDEPFAWARDPSPDGELRYRQGPYRPPGEGWFPLYASPTPSHGAPAPGDEEQEMDSLRRNRDSFRTEYHKVRRRLAEVVSNKRWREASALRTAAERALEVTRGKNAPSSATPISALKLIEDILTSALEGSATQEGGDPGAGRYS